MLDAFEATLDDELVEIVRFDCSAYHQGTALHPFARELTRLTELEADDPEHVRTEKLELIETASAATRQSDLAMLAELLELPSVAKYPRQELSPVVRKKRMLHALFPV